MSARLAWAYNLTDDFQERWGWPDPVRVPELDGRRCLARDDRGQCSSGHTESRLFRLPEPRVVSLCVRHAHLFAEVDEDVCVLPEDDNDNEEEAA